MKRLAIAFLFAALSARADTLLILNKSDATLQFVDAASFETLGTVATSEGPHEVAVSDDGKIAVVANYGTGPNPGTTLSIIDVVARKQLRRGGLRGVGGGPGGLAWGGSSCGGWRCRGCCGRMGSWRWGRGSGLRPRGAGWWRGMTRRGMRSI